MYIRLVYVCMYYTAAAEEVFRCELMLGKKYLQFKRLQLSIHCGNLTDTM